MTGGTTYPFTFYADRLTGSVGDSDQWRILWNAGGDTGYQTFNPGNNAYGLISNSVTAPAAATSGTIYFHFAGAASPGVTATIDLDDVTLGSGVSSPGSPAVTNILSVAILPIAQISWPSISGMEYQPESTTNLGAGPWSTNFPMIMGDGTTKSFLIPMTNSAMFFRLLIPPVVVLPPVKSATGSVGNHECHWPDLERQHVAGCDRLRSRSIVIPTVRRPIRSTSVW